MRTIIQLAVVLTCGFGLLPVASLRAATGTLRPKVVTATPEPLTEVLERLGSYYGVFFTYDAELVADRFADFALVEGEPLRPAVNRLLAGTGLAFDAFDDKYFVLYEASRRGRRDASRLRRKVKQLTRLEQRHNSNLLRADQVKDNDWSEAAAASSALLNARTVTGRVVDETGTPLVGVNIRVKGTDRGNISDAAGNFRVHIGGQRGRLMCSYLGYAEREVEVRRGERVTVQLRPQETELPEVVIIGYGEVNAAEATSSIHRLEAGTLSSAQTINTPHQWLQGKVAGVQVLGGNGGQGTFGSIRIRGASSMNASNEPLIVVDGMPVDNAPHAPGGFQPGRNPLNTLNPTDVASVTVLKDAAAGAIYGSRAANGVILIETKRAKLFRKPRWSYSGWLSLDRPAAKLDVHDAESYRTLVADIAPWRLPELGTADTDWQAEVLETAPSQQHTLSYAGGGERTAYRVSAGFLDRNDITVGAGEQRYNLALNGQHQLWKRQLVLTGDVKLARILDQFVAPTVFNNAYAFNPTLPVLDANSRWGGYFEYENDLTINNPVGEARQVEDESRVTRLLAHAKATFAPAFAPGLKATLYAGTDRTDGLRNAYAPATVRYQFATNGEFRLAEQRRRSYLWESYLNYDRRIADNRLGMAYTVGYTYQHFTGDYPEARYRGIENYPYAFGERPTARDRTVVDNFTENRLASFFGRGSFDWDHRYYLTASFRTDGSSRFNPDNRWASFPAFSAAWRVTEEAFMKGRPRWLTALKLRAGWGITGNQEIGDYQYLPTFTTGGDAVRFPFGDEYLVTARPNAISDRLKWEQTASTNFAIEASLLENRFSTTFEVYRSVTKDLLSRVVVPAGSNLSDIVLTNVGSIRNAGVELSAQLTAVQTKSFSWTLNANVATNENRILSLGPAPDRNFRAISTGTISGGTGNTIQIYSEGEALNAFYVFKHKWDASGRPLADGLDHNGDGMIDLADRYEDLNGDGKVDDQDKHPYHDPAPKVFGGLQSSVQYGHWGLHAAFRGQWGNYVYNNTAAVAQSYNRILIEAELLNVPLNIENYGFQSPQLFSDVFIEDASFVRLDALSIDYQLQPSKFISGGRCYATMRNVLTLTGYRGLDPEIGNVSGNPSVPRYGIDDLVFPRARTFVAGVNIDF